MLKWSIVIGILCISTQIYSKNIVVNTTDDTVRADDLCSLREAFEYVNAGMPQAGLNGCGGKDASAVIELKAETIYSVDRRINISKSVQLLTTYETSVAEKKGLKNATIRMLGREQLFNINDNSIVDTPISVRFNEVTLEGCGQSQGCANNGGILSNQELFTAEYVVFKNGVANANGGAIFNIGNLTNEEKSSGYVTILNSIFTNNTATQGAAIYSELPRFNVFKSVVRNNVSTDTTNGTILYSATPFSDTTTSGNFSSRIYGLKNSTLFANTGYVMNVRDGMVVNNITVIRNGKGLFLNAPLGNASLSNSVLLENGRYQSSTSNSNVGNCEFAANDDTTIQKNLVNATSNADCGSGTTANPNIEVANQRVIAGSSTEGSCDLPPADGLLCPFRTPKDQFLGFFKPRLLSSYSSINESLIINRGRVLSDGTSSSLAACEIDDQRGSRRGEQQNCDLGAIELNVNSADVDRVGQDLIFGEIAELSIADNLADGELVPAEQCVEILGSSTDRFGRAWQPGCLDIQQTNTPSKGRITLTAAGDLRYVPDSNWRGSDEFNIRVITSLTRLRESENKYLSIPARIVQDPPITFQNKTVNVGGGANGWLALFTLFGLIAFSRATRH